MSAFNLAAFGQCRILIVGDVMLDEYLWGRVQRISPEAPAPVVELERRTYTPGGAANVAANIVSLGGRAILGGVVGQDEHGRMLSASLSERGVEASGIMIDGERPTTTKTRVLAQNHQVLRLDTEQNRPLAHELEGRLLDWAFSNLDAADAIVLSDYNKGVVTPLLAQRLIQQAREHGRPVIVDPKGTNYGKYRGASVVTPNLREAAQALRIESDGDCDVEEIGSQLLARLDGSALVITRGQQGMSLFEPGARICHIPAQARHVFDVTGAGDTVISTLALALAAGMELAQAARLANLAGGIVVGKVGTATATMQELAALWEAD